MSPGSLPTVSPLTSSLYNVMMNQNNTPTTQPNEEISTIFVVGFPDDMQEREFQNMFIFSPGFEAATLKVPSKDQEEEMGLNTPTPSNPSTSLSAMAASNAANTNARKQIIGFAKFRTRLEALEAKDILSGRKVDAEKGSVLKAEMAKKNLHTKRGLSSDQQQQTTTPASTAPAAFPMAPQAIHPQKRFPGNPASAYEAFYSVPALPSDLLSPNEYPYDFYSDVFSPSTPTAFNDPSFASRAQSFDARSSSAGDVLGGGGGSQGNVNNGGVGINGAANGGLVSSSSARAPIGFNPGHRFSKGLIDLENDPTHPLSYLSKSTPVGSDRGFAGAALFGSSALTNGLNGAPQQSISSVLDEAQQSTSNNASNNANRDSQTPQPPTARFGSLSINTNSGGLPATNTASSTATNGLPSPGLGSPGYRGVNMIPAQNPADQNPPCNTLYVGNLPPNTSEDELKALFSRCVGYKRLSFRNKPNGPMCFVEFEDVACAAQALNDLYGNPLSNSVKGGIRLSYSKNPLGVRQNPTNNTSNNSSSSNTTTTNNNSTNNSSTTNTTTTPTNSNIINSINNTTSNVSSNNGIPISMMSNNNNNNNNQHNSFGYNPMVGGFSFSDRRESYSFDPQLS
ncbi:hypothetical protein INT43_001399 [Umbelopsis isabellina]|uniref:RRM domain-containing protein n=1 Tax=Mortierella isabellina TaxID=91625 RepID=A0A8H7U9N8_MORIS|nr:hypothetical protein INT43_001399 [Umbelopsis isabellina]